MYDIMYTSQNTVISGISRKGILMKRHAVFIFALCGFTMCFLLFFLASSCQETPRFPKDMKRIIFVSPQKDLPVWQQAEAGFLEASEKYGFYAKWTGSLDCNLEEMTRQIQIAIAGDIDAIVTCPLTPSVFDQVFQQAREEGIPILTVAVDASDPHMRSAFISSDYEKLGHDQAKALYEAVGEPMRIGIIMSTYDSQNQTIQVNELKKFIADKEDCEIVAITQDFANPITGMNVFTDMLETHPEINAMFVTSGDAIQSYGKILAEKNLSGEITLIGMDTIDANIRAVKSRQIYGIMDQDFYQMGFLSGEYAMKLLDGEEIPSETFCDSMLITGENADRYYPEVL